MISQLKTDSLRTLQNICIDSVNNLIRIFKPDNITPETNITSAIYGNGTAITNGRKKTMKIVKIISVFKISTSQKFY